MHKMIKKVIEGCKNYENKKYVTNDSAHVDHFITGEDEKNLDLLCSL